MNPRQRSFMNHSVFLVFITGAMFHLFELLQTYIILLRNYLKTALLYCYLAEISHFHIDTALGTEATFFKCRPLFGPNYSTAHSQKKLNILVMYK